LLHRKFAATHSGALTQKGGTPTVRSPSRRHGTPVLGRKRDSSLWERRKLGAPSVRPNFALDQRVRGLVWLRP
jgi:hypothetical protein